MPNEPSLPIDFLAAVAGLGRNLTQRLPDRDMFPLNPQAEKTFSPRDVGEFFLPQSPVDVLLGAIPGGKVGGAAAKRAAAKAADRVRYIVNSGFGPWVGVDWRTLGKTVPAVRDLKGKEYLGHFGHDLEHDNVITRYSLGRRKLERGHIDIDTGEWLTESQAAKKGVAAREAQRESRMANAPWAHELPSYNTPIAQENIGRNRLEYLRRGGSVIEDATPPVQQRRPEFKSPQELVRDSDSLTARIGALLDEFEVE